MFLRQHLEGRAPGTPPVLRRDLIEWRRRSRPLGPASAVRSVCEASAEPLFLALGFNAIEALDGQPGIVSGTLIGASSPLALVVTLWNVPLDPYWRTAIAESQRRHAGWCVLFNGVSLRLVQGRRVYSRRYAEIDVELAVDDEDVLSALWTLFGIQAFREDGGAAPIDQIVSGSERYGVAVCRGLREGVLTSSAELLGALVRLERKPALPAMFEQALTIVYRILFLLFAEARGLVPIWHPVYREGYSVAALRALAEQAPEVAGLWDTLRAMSRLAHRGCRAGDLRVTPFNGRLFAPGRTPLAEHRRVDDEAVRRAVLALATRRSRAGGGRDPIAYQELGVEQLGAVYETVLDYEPRLADPAGGAPVGPGGRPSSQVVLARGSGLRKATGTFYTPQPIAQYLVRCTLEPLVRDATPDSILRLKVLDPAMGSGAFLVAACEYLARAYEEALVRTGGHHPGDFGPAEQAASRRLVAERCLYGVDLNPMAVQLARLSLWLTTLAADRPLTFLDHHLQPGDSLLGAWLTNLRRAPPAQRRGRACASLPLFDDDSFGDALRATLPARFSLASIPGDTPEQVREKERLLAALASRGSAVSHWKRIADLWCARWFLPDNPFPLAAFGTLADAILTGRSVLGATDTSRLLEASEAAAAAHRFFHWELEFPEAFFEPDGARRAAPGFDAVIGNPPWDMVRADSGGADDRRRTRRDAAAIVRFTRDSGVYLAQSDGHANRYQLFLERAIALARPGGRIGLVLPAGVAVDHGSARLRRLLFARCAVDTVVGFDNRRRLFPIHRSVRFLLLTATVGAPTGAMRCRLGEQTPAGLERAGDDAGWLRISVAALERISGSDLALPELRSAVDLSIAERAAALFPPLGDEGGWGARFGRELNATTDRHRFKPPGAAVPVLEGKQLHPFRVDAAAARWSMTARDAAHCLGDRFTRPRLGYRDVASATNRMTLIAAVLPANAVSTHTLFCLRSALPARVQHYLCGLFNSLVLNYLARLRVTTHVTTAIVERLPVPLREQAGGAFDHVAGIAARLAGRGADQRREADRAQLDAAVARLYQLTRDEYLHVVDTFALLSRSEREAALAAFERTPPGRS
jgi:hypothetical protein